MKKIILIITLLVCLPIAAQVQFEKGYVIDNNDQKTECLIKNRDWNTIPDKIEYKISDSSEVVIGTFNDLKVFKIYNTNHYYKKFTFSLDTNTKSESQNISTITSFLRILVEGEASLYEYKENVFLYKNKDLSMKQLVYKEYENETNEVHPFQKELFVNLKIINNTIDLRKLKYNKKDLVKYFTHYNEFQKAEFEVFTKKGAKTKFNFNVFSGFGINSGEISYNQSFTGSVPPSGGGGFVEFNKTSTANLEKLKNYAIGFEAEIFLPFKKYKWSIFISPSYFFQEGTKVKSSENEMSYWIDKNTTINKMNYIEVPIGLKHYFYISKNSKLNIGSAYNFNFLASKNNILEIHYTNGNISLIDYKSEKAKAMNYLSFTSGYTYKDKYNVSINYYPSKKFKQGNHTINFENSIFVLLKYNLF